MGSLGNQSQAQSLIVLCTLCTALVSESRPMRRSVSEMQLMHDLGRLLYGSRRQELIKDAVRDVHTAGEKGLTLHAEPLGLKHPSSRKHLSSTGKQQSRLKNRRQRYGEKERIKRLFTDDFPEVGTLHVPDKLRSTLSSNLARVSFS
ncbi:parathyroid hormone-like [Scyliorhinus canicula]|uniref:parathyroid hormone-like n=1 Tax=Scyliorhinus canicula TaxID=7830 RepID=UPI0018F723C6|nr:parathyroid hormone-like [Scyliorhinus canicula]